MDIMMMHRKTLIGADAHAVQPVQPVLLSAWGNMSMMNAMSLRQLLISSGDQALQTYLVEELHLDLNQDAWHHLEGMTTEALVTMHVPASHILRVSAVRQRYLHGE